MSVGIHIDKIYKHIATYSRSISYQLLYNTLVFSNNTVLSVSYYAVTNNNTNNV